MVRLKSLVADMLPDVAVTVTVYAPGVVPGFPVAFVPLPHAARFPQSKPKSVMERVTVNTLLRRLKEPRSRVKATTAPPPPHRFGICSRLVVGAVVDTVRVAVALDADVIVTELAAPKLRVGMF